MSGSGLNVPMPSVIVISYMSVLVECQMVCSCKVSDRSVFFRYQLGNSVIDYEQKTSVQEVILGDTSSWYDLHEICYNSAKLHGS